MTGEHVPVGVALEPRVPPPSHRASLPQASLAADRCPIPEAGPRTRSLAQNSTVATTRSRAAHSSEPPGS